MPNVENDARYVVTTPRGFTETFDARTIETLVRLGLIEHERDGHVLEDGHGNGVGPLHHFYREAPRVFSPEGATMPGAGRSAYVERENNVQRVAQIIVNAGCKPYAAATALVNAGYLIPSEGSDDASRRE